jgi:hypothetical protein
MANVVGTPIVNPTFATSTVAETYEYTLASTALSGSAAINATTITVNASAGFTVDGWIIIDTTSSAETTQVTAISGNTLTIYPALKNNHSSGAAVVFKVQRQTFVAAPNKKSIITPSTPISITSISTAPGVLVSVINANTSPQTITISFYDEGSSPSGNINDFIYGAYQLGAGQVVMLNIPFTNGLAYSLSSACLANIIVVWN